MPEWVQPTFEVIETNAECSGYSGTLTETPESQSPESDQTPVE